MKKLLLTFFMAVAFISAKAVTATVYVQAETAPYLYGWFTVNGLETKINGAWPGKQLTQSTTKTNKDGEEIEFWYITFDFPQTSSFNIIFNNGNTSLMQQTGNIADIASDRYFTYDGKTKYTDITEDFGVEIPDVEIQSVAMLDKFNEFGWKAGATPDFFTEIEKNVKYTYNIELSEEELEEIENYYSFMFIVNSSAYLGADTKGLTCNDPNEWLEVDLADGGGSHFGIALDDIGVRAILFTMEFAGGKDIYQGWTLTVSEGTAGIYGIPYDATQSQPRYNLSGQRISPNYRGVVVTKGKKLLVK